MARTSRDKPVEDAGETVIDTNPDVPDPEEEQPPPTPPVEEQRPVDPDPPEEQRPEAPARFEEPREAPEGGRVIKYMGTADQKVIQAGETASRTLPKINRTLRWNRGNDFIIDTSDYPEVAEEWWDHLVAFDDFEDFTGKPATDISKHQAMFQGMKKIKGQVAPAPGQFPTPQ